MDLEGGTRRQQKRSESRTQNQAREIESETFREKFGSREYIQTYYPEQLDTSKLLAALRDIQNQSVGGRFNIRQMVADNNMSHETAENILIFDFQRKVAKALLIAYPKDNIRVLDVGGGPTIYQHIALSLEARSVTHSEFLKQNRDEAQQWINGGSDAYNWDAYFDLIKNMLQEDSEYQDILKQQAQSDEEDVRSHASFVQKIIEGPGVSEYKKLVRERLSGNVVHGDVFRSDLGLANQDGFEAVSASSRESGVEMITSNFTVESATGDRNVWERGMKNIMAKVKPNGFLALTAIRNADWYKVGNEKMPAVKVNEKDIEKICEENGFEIQELRVLDGSDKDTVGYDGMVFVLAKKIVVK